MPNTAQATTPNKPPAWGFYEAVCIQLIVIAVAVGYQGFQKHYPLPTLEPPMNWVVAIGLTLVAMTLGAVFAKKPWMRWLSGAPFAVTIITFITIISFLGAFLIQEPQLHGNVPDVWTRYGLRAIFTSPPFLVALLMLMLNLALVTGRRMMTPKRGYLAFMLNHLGLLVLFIGAFAGSVQQARPYMYLPEGMPVDIAQDEHGTNYDIGAKVTLQKFDIENFPPKLGIVDMGKMQMGQRDSVSYDSDLVSDGHVFRWHNYKITVLKYLPNSDKTANGEYAAINNVFAAPAVQLEIAGPEKTMTKWLTPDFATATTLTDGYDLFLEKPMPKGYRSTITIAKPGKAPEQAVVEVNKPVKVGQWVLVQSSYDTQMGVPASVLQAVRDPGLPVVYTGMIAIMLGAVIAFWFTPRRREGETSLLDTEEESQS